MKIKKLLLLFFTVLILPISYGRDTVSCKTDYYIGGVETVTQGNKTEQATEHKINESHNFNYISFKYEDGLASFDDSLLPMNTCENSKAWTCIVTNDVKLYVPSKPSIVEGSWEYDEEAYKVLMQKKIWLLGKLIELNIVLRENVNDSEDRSYYYLTDSKELIGFTLFESQGRSQTYWLMETNSSFACKNN